MSFLPIVARELRGASRRRGTYWVRTLVAAIAVGTGVVIFLATLGTPAAQSGRTIFQGLSGLLLLYCLASGRALTVDCLSVEKREGTLGLLFLTDLKGYDVVLGKLVATSLNGLYALLAVMPVLAFSMLLGAVANAEFWRMVLVLADSFALSLAIGIFCSALSRDARRASAANFALILLLVGVLPAMVPIIDYFHPGHPLIQPLFYTCPGYSFYLSFDAPYKLAAVHFWRSVGIIHALTWLLIALAGWIVPHTWQDKTARTGKARFRDLWQAWNYGPVAGRPHFRKRMLDENAFYWLAGRARFKPLHVWTFLGLMACWWIWGVLRAGDVWWSNAIVIFVSLILNSTLKLWITLEAGQQLAEDQRMGTMELLLPTPLTARDILHGQWLALRRQFLPPLFAAIAAEIALTAIALWHRSDHQIVFLMLTGLLALLADSYALAWVSMRRALTARSASRAIIGTVSRILVLPWIGYGAIQLVISIRNILWPENIWEPEWSFNLAVWFGLGMAADLLFGLPARHQLLRGFRRLAMHRFESRSSRLSQSSDSATTQDNLVGTGSSSTLTAAERVRRILWRRKAIAFSVVLVLLAVAVFHTKQKTEFKYPPPVVVHITQSNSPLSISPGQETLLMLPNGSFWRWGPGGTGSQSAHDVPVQVGQSHDWAQVDCSYYSGVGLQRNGTLWAWGMTVPGRTAGRVYMDFDPMPMAPGNDWASATTGGSDSLAIKKDGTLWSWSNRRTNPSGGGPWSAQTNALQIGTNHDWAATRALGNISLGVRTDGTLWIWGQIYLSSNGAWRSTQIPLPIQVCRETNWAGFEKGFGILAWTRSGELWQLPLNSPNAEASIASNGRLIVSNSGPGRFASALHYGNNNTSPLVFFRLKDDGTLWECDSPAASSLPGTWHQTGTRSDWISLWGGGGTAFGLTRDGTIWTWGTDWTRNASIPFSARWHMLQNRISGLFKPTPGSGGISPAPAYQELPRPLMRIVMTGTNQSAYSTNLVNSKLSGH